MKSRAVVFLDPWYDDIYLASLVLFGQYGMQNQNSSFTEQT